MQGEERVKKTTYHDLDHLSGMWTEEEGEIFTTFLDSQRQIDEDMWEKPNITRQVDFLSLELVRENLEKARSV